MSKEIIIIYNAQSWLRNAISDGIHKIVSPDTYPCQLCSITHWYFKEKQKRAQFLKNIPYQTHTYHKDEIDDLDAAPELPAIWIRTQNNSHDTKYKRIIEWNQRDSITTVDNLIETIQNAL